MCSVVGSNVQNDPPCLVVAHFDFLPFLIVSTRVALNGTVDSVHFLTFLQCRYQSNATKVSDCCEADHSAVILSKSLYHDVEVCVRFHAQQ